MSKDLEVIELRPAKGKAAIPVIELGYVRNFTARIKKISTTDDGKLAVQMEAEVLSEESLKNVRDMLALQQSGPVIITIEPIQQELFS